MADPGDGGGGGGVQQVPVPGPVQVVEVPGTGGPGPAAPAASAAVAFPTGRPTLDARGRLALALRCTGGQSGCAGTVTLRRGARTAGTAVYVIPSGGKATVRVPIGRAHRKATSLQLSAKAQIGNAPKTATVKLAVARRK